MKTKQTAEEQRLQKIADAVLSYMNRMDGEVAVHIVDDVEMERLNSLYRNKQSTTTVLSFEMPDFPCGKNQKKFLGDIFLSPKHIATREESLEFFLVHGVLHLIGFNHEEKHDTIEMENTERKILSWLKTTF